MAFRVETISIAPVKGLALSQPGEVLLERTGVRTDRRFYLVDGAGLLVNGKRHGTLVRIGAEYDDATGTLALRLPGGETVAGEVAVDGEIETNFYGRPVRGRLVQGPFGAALSEFAGEPLRLVRPDAAGDALDRGGSTAGASLISTASLDALARATNTSAVDGRRFRMLLCVSGCEPHEEDTWLGRDVRVGEALVAPLGNVGRCAVTTHDPATGIRDLDTLAALKEYRGELPTTEPLPFGIWAEVVEPGLVRCGDEVRLES
jgi:uncharacterized protein YcbX